MVIMLGHLSNGLWTLCLVPMEPTIEGQGPLWTGGILKITSRLLIA